MICWISAVQATPAGNDHNRRNTPQSHRFETKAVHAGYEPGSSSSHPVVTPIVLSTTFVQSYPGVKPGIDDLNSYAEGYAYSRISNPTRGCLERALAAVEGSEYCATFSSGQAASQAVIQLLHSGDHVIASNDLYGGTSGLFRTIATPSAGINFTFMGMDDMKALEAAVTPNTRMIFLETPTNPLLRTIDIAAVAALAKKHQLLLVVDSTFMSPYLQHPLRLGADIVMHSLTKYISGHSDVLMGAVMTNDDATIKRLRAIQAFAGSVPSPFECYLALRGLKTLSLRIEASQKSAHAIALFLETHPVVQSVMYPGLRSYPQYDLARRQTSGAGAMVSFNIKGGVKVAARFLQELQIFAMAVSLGAVESLACSPALMTHTAVPLPDRLAIGLTDGLIRLSIGIEHVDDLIDDLRRALDKALDELKSVEDLQK